MDIEMILNEVERLRDLMHRTALSKGISHPDVLIISQNLDKKLNEYNRLKFSLENQPCAESLGKIKSAC